MTALFTELLSSMLQFLLSCVPQHLISTVLRPSRCTKHPCKPSQIRCRLSINLHGSQQSRTFPNHVKYQLTFKTLRPWLADLFLPQETTLVLPPTFLPTVNYDQIKPKASYVFVNPCSLTRAISKTWNCSHKSNPSRHQGSWITGKPRM